MLNTPKDKFLRTGYVDDLAIASDDTNPEYKITIQPGRAKADDNVYEIVSDSVLTVDLTASGAGGLDTGSETSSAWYYVFLIGKRTNAAVAGLLSLSPTAPTMPNGYDIKRRIGTVRNGSAGDLLKFGALGNGRDREYLYREPSNDLTVLLLGSATSWTDVDCSAFIPPVTRFGRFGWYNGDGNKIGYVKNSYCAEFMRAMEPETGGSDFCETNADQEVQYKVEAGGGEIILKVWGFKEAI